MPKFILPVYDTDRKKEYQIELSKENYLEKFKDTKYLLLIRASPAGDFDFLNYNVILGQPFFKNYYAVFDSKKDTI